VNIADRMIRTTVYLPPALRQRLKRYSAERGIRQAHVVRLGIETVVGGMRAMPEGGFLREPDGRERP
jgi:predicted DNA-binding protein